MCRSTSESDSLVVKDRDGATFTFPKAIVTCAKNNGVCGSEDKIDNFRFEWDRLVADEYNDTVKKIMNTKVSICVARPHKPSDCENITDEYVTQWKQDQLITDKLFYYNPFGPNAPTAVLREHLKAQCRRDMKMYERYKDDFKTYANKPPADSMTKKMMMIGGYQQVRRKIETTFSWRKTTLFWSKTL